MLVLSREVDEQITLDFSQCTLRELVQLAEGPPITLQIVDVRGNKVRIGVTAPKPVGVHRLEVYEQIKIERPYHTVILVPKAKNLGGLTVQG